MRYLIGLVCVLALSVMPMVGCSETTGDGGSGGMAGSGGTGGMPECQSPEDCDDFNDCTGNACADGMCEYTAVADGTACDESNECTTGMCANGECDTTPVQDGTACGNEAGTCQQGSCQVACTEQGIRDAIAAGGGPYTFACNGPQTVVTVEEIVIDKDVILDGEGKLTVDGNAVDTGNGGIFPLEGHTVFSIADSDIVVELRGIGVTGGGCPPDVFGVKQATGGCFATGILVENLSTASQATLTLTDCTVWNNEAIGVYQNVGGTLTLLNTTVADSGLFNVQNQGGVLTVIGSTISNGGAAQPEFSAGLWNTGQMTMLNSTVSGSEGAGIASGGATGTATLTNCTVSGNAGGGVRVSEGATVTLAGTVVDGDCSADMASSVVSDGYNIESPSDTCGFDQPTDMPDMSAEELKLRELADNGGPTKTHALEAGSEAIDKIPDAMCEVDGDQRGVARPQGDSCDVGAFELEAGP